MKNKTIEYLKGSKFVCAKCQKQVAGPGYLFNLEPLCLRHYQAVFPSFQKGGASK